MPRNRTRRRLRCKLGAPPVAASVYGGPPALGLEDRAALLASLRSDIEGCGLRVAEIRGGWRYRVLDSDADADVRVRADEARASSKCALVAARCRLARK
jgi:hypothetical protein